MKRFLCSLSLAALAFCAAPVLAADVNETEQLDEAINNTIATAQILSASDFTTTADPNVFGTLPTATLRGGAGLNDVDFYAFQANAGTAYFDVDQPFFNFDSALALFDSNGTLIGFSDNSSPADSGSQSDADPFLGVFTLPSAGTYYAAVSSAFNLPNQLSNPGITLASLIRPDDAHGGSAVSGAAVGNSSFGASGTQIGDSGYRLRISISPATSPVPEPGGIALLAGMSGGIVVFRCRRR